MKRNSGFSLVEVSVALGICATGMLLTIAVLPAVLNSLDESVDRNAFARIRQSLAARYAMMDWSVLEDDSRDQSVDTYYFDFAGTEIEKDAFDATYAARVRVGERRTLSGDDEHNRFVRSLEIKISSDLISEDAFSDPLKYETFTVSLGNEAKLLEKYRD